MQLLTTVLVYSLVCQTHNTFAIKPDHHLKNKIDFMNIEVRSKYTVDTVGNEMSDVIDDNNRVITFDDQHLENIDRVYGSQSRVHNDVLNNHEGEKIQNNLKTNKTINGNRSNENIYKKIITNRLDEITSEKNEPTIPFISEVGFHEQNELQKLSLLPITRKKPLKNNEQIDNIDIDRLSDRSDVHQGFSYKTEDVKPEGHSHKSFNFENERNEDSKTNTNNIVDPIKQIKLGVINSLKRYSDTMKVNTTLLKLDNFEINLIKKPETPRVVQADVKNFTEDELDKQLIDNLLRAIQSHQINMRFVVNDRRKKDGLFNQFVSIEGRGKKKKTHHHGAGTACSVALAMTLGGLLFLKMITMKAMLFSLMSLFFSMKKGGGLAGRQIEAKYQVDSGPAALTAPVCNCKCNGERNHLGTSGAYKYYNDHKNGYITVEANGEDVDHLNDGTEYLPHQMGFKNIYLPSGGAFHSARYERREDAE